MQATCNELLSPYAAAHYVYGVVETDTMVSQCHLGPFVMVLQHRPTISAGETGE